MRKSCVPVGQFTRYSPKFTQKAKYSQIRVHTGGFCRYSARKCVFYTQFSYFRLGETLNWNNGYARPRYVEIVSKGRSVLKSIQHFRTDALIQKVSPELAPGTSQRFSSYVLGFSDSVEKNVSGLRSRYKRRINPKLCHTVSRMVRSTRISADFGWGD